MSDNSANNKRIAKNTIYLYLRTLVVLAVSLYTSRLVLQVLGAEDLGVYNVVGGIVALMSFFQVAQTKATSRFITYELGQNSEENKLKKVFSACMSIHIILALVAIVLGETIGLWIITHWTDIPVERQSAAMWVYQFAITVFVIHIVRVPYDAVIVAHEKMSMYAYMSILEAGLQLGLVLIIMHSNFDSLILYSGLMALTAFILYIAYYSYVKIKHKVYSFHFCWDKEYSSRILSFSGWTLLGSGANTGTQQGVNLLFNNYVGLIANAAMGFASQVNIAVGKFVNGFSTAFTPQIIKLFAQGDYQNLHLLMHRASKFSFALCYIMALPLIANMDFILHLWLGENVPQYTCEFCQLILICTIIDSTTGVFNTAITATGNIRKYQVMISISFTLDLFFCFLLFLTGLNPALVFASRILTRGIFNMFIGLHFTRKQIDFDILSYTRKVLVPIVTTILITIPTIWVLDHFSDGWIQFFSTGSVSVLLICICVLYIIMNRNERKVVYDKINSIIKK